MPLPIEKLKAHVKQVNEAFEKPWTTTKPPTLPISGHWATGFQGAEGRRFNTWVQLEYLADGNFLMPTFAVPKTGDPETAYIKARDWGLDLLFRVNQPEQQLAFDPNITDGFEDYKEDPRPVLKFPESPSGPIQYRTKWLTPYNTSPENIENWNLAGKAFVQENLGWEAVSKIYKPNRIILLNNHESARIRPKHYNYDARLSEDGLTRNQINERMQLGYLYLYDAFYAGVKEALKELFPYTDVKIIFYNEAGPTFAGRFYGWDKEGPNIVTKEIPDFTFMSTEINGGSAELYTNDWGGSMNWRDDKIFSPQVECINSIAIRDYSIKTLGDKNRFFTESVWDGNWSDTEEGPYSDKVHRENRDDYISDGQEWSAERYKGWQFFLTLLHRANISFEFRGSATNFSHFQEEFEKRLEVFKEIRENKILSKMFLEGDLVESAGKILAYDKNIDKYAFLADRKNYLLVSTANPIRLTLDADVKVFAAGLEYKISESRSCKIIFAFSPSNRRGELLSTRVVDGERAIPVLLEGPEIKILCIDENDRISDLQDTLFENMFPQNDSEEEDNCSELREQVEELRDEVDHFTLILDQKEEEIKELKVIIDSQAGQLQEKDGEIMGLVENTKMLNNTIIEQETLLLRANEENYNFRVKLQNIAKTARMINEIEIPEGLNED